MKQPEYQIDSLFSVLDYGFKIVLEGENNQPCLTITKKGNELIMDILDPEQLKNKIHDNKTEKPLLQMLLLYGHLGNLKAVQKECLMHEDIDSLVEQIIDVQVKTSERLNTGDMSF